MPAIGGNGTTRLRSEALDSALWLAHQAGIFLLDDVGQELLRFTSVRPFYEVCGTLINCRLFEELSAALFLQAGHAHAEQWLEE